MNPNKLNDSGYAMIEQCDRVVLPVEVAMQVFTLLCQGDRVSYDWQTKTYRYDREYQPTLKMMSIKDYATLSIAEE